MQYVYVIYSQVIDTYYVGQTSNPEKRLFQHNSGYFKGAYTAKAKDWKIKVTFSFPDYNSAVRAETFIKRMKSRKFVERLIEDGKWLEEKFKS